MDNNQRKIWQFPWQYKESLVFVGGIVLIGFVLQLAVGIFDFTLLQWPVNIILGGVMILFLFLFATKRKSMLYLWFSGIPMAVTLIGTLLVLGIIMGLTPQLTTADSTENFPSHLGLTRMTSSWPFVLVYLITLLSLGALIIRRMIPFRIKNYAFYLNHTGLWLLLFSAGMGASDIKNYAMYIYEGETEWRAHDDQNNVANLPVAIELNDFYMEEYPPKLAIIDRETGFAQPEGKPFYYQIDEKQREGNIAGWHISLKEYIHQAVRNSDSTYHEVRMPGASPAAKIEIRNLRNGISKEGWVCAGNLSQLYMVLNLNEKNCVIMTSPEPKRFVSDINVFSEDGHCAHTLLEVNKPYKLGHWMLYQYGYDQEAGNLSSYSIIKLVYDPWMIPVYTGILLLACGSVCMLWSGNKRKEEDDDMG